MKLPFWQHQVGFTDNAKHDALAGLIRGSHNDSVAAVGRLFEQLMIHCIEGDLSTVSDTLISRWANHKKVTRSTLTQSGWMDPDGHIHGWEEIYGTLIEKRNSDKERKRKERAAKRAALPNCHADSPRTVHEMSATEEEGRGREKKGNVVVVGGVDGQAAPLRSAVSLFFEEIYQGPSAQANARNRADELRTTLRGMERWVDAVARVLVQRAHSRNNPESYLTSAVRQSFCRNIAAELESKAADEHRRFMHIIRGETA